MKKYSNTEAELKKNVAYTKKCVTCVTELTCLEKVVMWIVVIYLRGYFVNRGG